MEKLAYKIIYKNTSENIDKAIDSRDYIYKILFGDNAYDGNSKSLENIYNHILNNKIENSDDFIINYNILQNTYKQFSKYRYD